MTSAVKIRFYYQLVVSIISFISFQKGKLMSLYLGRLLLLGIANYHIIYCFIGDLLPFHGSGLRSMLLNSWITPNAHQNWDVTIIIPFYGKGKGNSFWVLTSVARNPGLEIVIIWKKSWGQRSYPLSPSVLRCTSIWSNLQSYAGQSVHTSANLIFHFSNKIRKRKYLLSSLHTYILRYRENENGQENWQFVHFSNFEVLFKNTKNCVNG